jgi:hypothetical protein
VPYNDTRGNWSQRHQRAEMTFQDQHEREYYAAIELKTGDPTGLIEPLFRAPLMPPQKYLVRRNKRRPYDIEVDYVAWKRDVRTARRAWEREGRQLAQKMHGSKYDPREPFSMEVLDVIGPPPEAIEPIIAAEQGNRWVLGLSKKVDERLVKFFEPEDVDPDYRDREDSEEEDEDYGGSNPARTKHEDDRVRGRRQVDPDEEEEEHDRGATGRQGGRRVNPKAEKPAPRAATKGEGKQSNRPKRGPGGKFQKTEQPFGKDGVTNEGGHALLSEDQQQARSAARTKRRERELAEV